MHLRGDRRLVSGTDHGLASVKCAIERPLSGTSLCGRLWPRPCKNGCEYGELDDDGAPDRGELALALFVAWDALAGSYRVRAAYEVDCANLAREIRAFAAQALIARIISPMPKMRITRFRL